jgi:hypothetical protein
MNTRIDALFRNYDPAETIQVARKRLARARRLASKNEFSAPWRRAVSAADAALCSAHRRAGLPLPADSWWNPNIPGNVITCA